MNVFMRSILAVSVVSLLAAGSAQAEKKDHPCRLYELHCHKPAETPEIDLAMGTGALALIGGAVMVIRGRRKA
jgi:hypothetical protein